MSRSKNPIAWRVAARMSLPAERRAEIARIGAAKRWANHTRKPVGPKYSRHLATILKPVQRALRAYANGLSDNGELARRALVGLGCRVLR